MSTRFRGLSLWTLIKTLLSSIFSKGVELWDFTLDSEITLNVTHSDVGLPAKDGRGSTRPAPQGSSSGIMGPKKDLRPLNLLEKSGDAGGGEHWPPGEGPGLGPREQRALGFTPLLTRCSCE